MLFNAGCVALFAGLFPTISIILMRSIMFARSVLIYLSRHFNLVYAAQSGHHPMFANGQPWKVTLILSLDSISFA